MLHVTVGGVERFHVFLGVEDAVACLADGGELSQLDRIQVLASQALRAEKKHYWEEFYEGNLTEAAYKQLAQDVDYQTDHVKVYGRLPESFEEASTRESTLDRLLYRLGIFKGYLQKRKVSQIADHFEENCAETAATRSVAAVGPVVAGRLSRRGLSRHHP